MRGSVLGTILVTHLSAVRERVAILLLLCLSSLVRAGLRDEVKALAGSSVSLRCAVNR